MTDDKFQLLLLLWFCQCEYRYNRVPDVVWAVVKRIGWQPGSPGWVVRWVPAVGSGKVYRIALTIAMYHLQRLRQSRHEMCIVLCFI